jgi:hypothetical protein
MGGTTGHAGYNLNKAIEVAEAVYKRRRVDFTDIDKELMRDVFNITLKNRRL